MPFKFQTDFGMFQTTIGIIIGIGIALVSFGFTTAANILQGLITLDPQTTPARVYLGLEALSTLGLFWGVSGAIVFAGGIFLFVWKRKSFYERARRLDGDASS
ncbi:hypothetical protein NTE_01807 [Candidatus Nitrososphaera evergladensis SR1]|uniref:Uncharacterized protein n=2 Tax=Nitrososphaera TaxID=497726 RepID=A0A075MRS6_9ARCH|nr:hypothetical protein NTE_01807 [Candidatus Nitrososphaera evergladensis SR1]